MLWLWAKLTIVSAGPKLKTPCEGSVVCHFISLPGVTPSNCVWIIFVYALVPRRLASTATPMVLPLAAPACARVVAAEAGRSITALKHSDRRRNVRGMTKSFFLPRRRDILVFPFCSSTGGIDPCHSGTTPVVRLFTCCDVKTFVHKRMWLFDGHPSVRSWALSERGPGFSLCFCGSLLSF